MRRLYGIVFSVIVLVGSLHVSAQTGLPPVEPQQLSGNISAAGSIALVGMTQQLSVNFGLDGFLGLTDVQPSDTTSALQSLCSGTLDIALADRQITPDEVNLCNSNTITPLAFRIATDGIVVIVSQQNIFLNDLTTADLQRVYSTAINWEEINPDWVSNPIARFGPATDSSTFQFFANAVFGGDTRAMITALGARYGGSDDEIAANVASNPQAIGFMSSEALTRNAGRIRTITINGIIASQGTIVSNSYDLSRPLFFYSSREALQTRPEVAGFINYAITNSTDLATQVNLYPASTVSLQEATTTWLNALGQQPAQQPPQAGVPAVTEEPFVDDFETATPPLSVPTATPAPTEPASLFDEEVVTLLANSRTDLEILAGRVLGAQRPPGWSGSLDANDPDLPLLLRLDTEILAAALFGLNTRPDNWFGAVASTQLSIARDIRHDLEILGDEVFGDSFVRPLEWAGSDAVLRCSRATQALADVLNESTSFNINRVSATSPTYCEDLEVAAARYAEINLVDLSPAAIVSGRSGGSSVVIPGSVAIDSRFAVGFTDRFASASYGVIPLDTSVAPLARSYTQFSNMLLVEGPDFVMFVDYLDTTLSREAFEDLPQAEDNAPTFCEARWCR